MAVLAVLALVGAACSKSKPKAKSLSGSPASPAATSATYPLTGRPVTVPANAARAAVAVKIDNNVEARPQAGIDKADLVYEEFTEGITRFVVIFQSTDADPVGPVRSVRPADPVIVFPMKGVLAFSGGSPAVLALVPGAPVKAVTENDTDVMKRRAGRAAPHNLYTTTAGLFGKAPPGSAAPPPFSPFLGPGQQFKASGATPVAHISLTPAPGVKADYAWDQASGTWKRSTDGKPHMLEGGAQIAPQNVIVQTTPYLVFQGDSKVKYPEIRGTGDAVVFAGGTMVKAKWSKPTPQAVTTYTDLSGAPIVLPPGQTWVHLVAPDAAMTTS
ncbi:MAG: DUF3048 domain-containing protein [Acidimicrobiales bacterium]